MHLYIYIYIYVYVYISIHLFIYVLIDSLIYLFICVLINLFIYLFIYLCIVYATTKKAYSCDRRQHIFHPRAGQPLLQRTHWELLCELLALGWSVIPSTGCRVEPLDLTAELKESEMRLYFNRTQLDVSFHYLACLLSLEQLKKDGHKQVKHRQISEYYKELLGLPVQKPRQGMVEDTADCSQPMMKGVTGLAARARVRAGVARVQLALEDGDSDDGGSVNGGGNDGDDSEGDPEEHPPMVQLPRPARERSRRSARS